MAIPECTRALEGGILNIVYLHVDYFGDKSYREEFDATNINPKFIEAVIDTGLIWDPKTNKFDIPISQKYSLPTE
jgi:hypothetical protein